MNPLKALATYGQSPWFDYIRRSLLTSGELKAMIEQDGLKGVTSNPAIFEKAIVGSSDYTEALAQAQQKSRQAKTVYETLAIADLRDAATIMHEVYLGSRKTDGYVSLEVSPYLARDTQGTIEEARRLWASVNKPNLMVKVPATAEGLPAIQQLIGEGININVTLLFSVETYAQVAEAYLTGLESLAARHGDLGSVASVASFFVSRIDLAVDKKLELIAHAHADPATRSLAKNLIGQVAIANAKLAYLKFQEMYRGPRWTALASQGAQKQRLLWASTSTKNPAYRDVRYVEELIGPETVNTIPPATYNAFRDHGQLRASLTERLEKAQETLLNLQRVDINFTAITQSLLKEGLGLFSDAFDKLLTAVDTACKVPAQPLHQRQRWSLPSAFQHALTDAIDDWRAGGKTRRLWSYDASLWTKADEAQWLGWLTITDDQLENLAALQQWAQDVKSAGFEQVLLLGMGGSSLCPEVLSKIFGKMPGFPKLLVLDSTDPGQIRRFGAQVQPAKTLFIVSSKSGSTLEPNLFKQYFFEVAAKALGRVPAGDHFVAITDPDSHLQKIAETDHFWRSLPGVKTIGGRFSALSNFGMVPAAALGLDVKAFLSRTGDMVHSCSPCVPLENNPGIMLGLILGVAGQQGRDKITLITSPSIQSLGAWLEQLLAESTGKEGKGLIPIDLEELGEPAVYGPDRMFCYVRDKNAADSAQDARIEALEKAGQPVVRIDFWDKYDLGQEFFRWEIATAVAGAVLGINPFNQPDVEASKNVSRQLTAEYETKGAFPAETPFTEGEGLKLFTDARNAAELSRLMQGQKSVEAALRAHLQRLRAGDYFGLLAYLEMDDAHQKLLQAVRHAVRQHYKVATCLGFGPRFLHSTGQAYKGGPNTGVFLQLTGDAAVDVPVPGQKYTFGIVKAAQARGDFTVLAQRERRALRVHLGADTRQGLITLQTLVQRALG